MGEGVAGDGFEGFVDVDAVFGGDFEVWDWGLIRFTPCQRPFLRHLPSISPRLATERSQKVSRQGTRKTHKGER